MGYIYLGQPYSHPDPAVMQHRFELARDFIGRRQPTLRTTLYSPIVHFHEVAQCHKLPTDAAWWQAHNEAMLEAAKELWVLTIEGYEQSKGLAHEIAFATNLNIPVVYVMTHDQKKA